MHHHPVRLTVSDELRRSRLSVLFRLLLALPHLLWLALWSTLAAAAALVAYLFTLLGGINPEPLHDFLAAYVRYSTHVWAYLSLTADPYPGFGGRAGSYPICVEIDPPARQSRWKTGFRLLLAVPTTMLAASLAGASWSGNAGVLGSVAVLAWFACLALGRMPGGLRNLAAYTLRYQAQQLAYLLLLTDRYPDSDPRPQGAARPGEHPIALRIEDGDRRRARMAVAFLLPLAVPHLVWLLAWALVVLVLAPVNWLLTLALGRSPRPLHRFGAAYLRYSTHVSAFLYLVGGRFPGFTGAAGSYPVDLEIAPPAGQRRWTTALRGLLVLPAAALSSALSGLLVLVAVFGWFVSLALGRMPEGLRRLGGYTLRYSGQVSAYGWLLLTDRYPDSDPAAELPAEPVLAVAAA